MAYLIYILLSIVCCYCLSQAWLDKRFSVHDGFVLGGLYFFLMPSLLTLFAGPIEAEGLPIEPFSGMRLDIAVFVALCMLPLMVYAMQSPVEEVASGVGIGRFKFYFCVSIVATLLVFVLSGKGEGKHWADSSTTDSLAANLLSVLLLVLRTYMFALGIIVLKRAPQALYYLLFYTLVDIFLTGNRIAALYLAVAVLFSGRYRLYKLIVPAMLMAIPTVLFLSMYPAFRGVLWSEFGGFSGVFTAAEYVYRNYDFSTLNGRFVWYFFEAANASVFQHLFDTYGHSKDFIDGATVLIKPLSLFVPRDMWPDKPEGLGIRLGPEIAGIDGLSLNSLMLGEFWVNFGWGAPLAIASTMLVIYAVYRSGTLLRRDDIARFGFLLGFASWRHEFNYFVFSTIAGCALIYALEPVSSWFDSRAEAR